MTPFSALRLRAVGGGGSSDPHWANVSLLLHCDGAHGSTVFVDSSSRPKTVTAGGDASISTAEARFGGASATFDGAGDSLGIADHADLRMGTGDWTIEGWVRLQAIGAFRVLVALGNTAAAGSFAIRISNANELQLLLVGGSGSSLGTNVIFQAGVWTHFAVTREGTRVRGFIDGQLLNSAITNATNHAPTSGFVIGGPSFLMSGHMDDIRITKGVARYTASFSPPTGPYPNG